MPNPIAVKNGSGGTTNIASATLADGTSAPVHAVTDGNQVVVPALDSSIQQLITLLGGAVVTSSGPA